MIYCYIYKCSDVFGRGARVSSRFNKRSTPPGTADATQIIEPAQISAIARHRGRKNEWVNTVYPDKIQGFRVDHSLNSTVLF